MNCGDFPAFRDLPKTHTHKHKGQCHSDGILLSEITKTISRVGTLHINPSQQRRVIIHLSGGKTKCIDTTRNILTDFLGHISLFYDQGSLGKNKVEAGIGKAKLGWQKSFSQLDLCEGRSFSTAIFNTGIQLRVVSFSCFISVCPFIALLKATYAEHFAHYFV